MCLKKIANRGSADKMQYSMCSTIDIVQHLRYIVAVQVKLR